MKQKKTMVLFSFLLCLFSASAYTVYNQRATANGYTWTYRYDTVTGDATIYGPVDEDGASSSCPDGMKGSVTVPSSLNGHPVVGIGEYAFYRKSSITTISVPSSVTSIGEHAFEYCSGLTAVSVPSTVTSIGYGAFYRCSGLTTITIPSSVTSVMWTSILDGCSALQSVLISASNPNYASVNGIVYDKTGQTLLFCPQGCVSVSISSTVKVIAARAFAEVSGLTSVDIPANVQRIEADAFSNCQNLLTVTLHEGLNYIGWNAFGECYNRPFCNSGQKVRC